MTEEKNSRSKEPNVKKPNWSLLRFVGNSHPSFLKALRETQSLSELAALSIIVAAFSESDPIARQYAVVAGAVFLVAFVFSTLVVLGARELMLELFSYVLTGLGIVFLAGVVLEYVVASKLLGSTLGLAGDIVVGVLQLGVLPFFVRGLRKDLRVKIHLRDWYISIGADVIGLGFTVYSVAYWLVYTPYRVLVLGVSGDSLSQTYSLVAALGGVVVAITLIKALRRSKLVKIEIVD